MNIRVESAVNEIIDQYCNSDKSETPWFIGFSGGKDSTALLTLVWMALLKVKQQPNPFQLKRKVYIVNNDTRVENPIIEIYVDGVLGQIEEAAKLQGLPIFVKKTKPKIDESFWVNVIGRGYPVPNNTFRWCTDRLKIRPTSSVIAELEESNKEAIVLLGTRLSESQSRSKSIKKHEVKGRRLSKHPNHNSTFVYSPIKHLLLGDVWEIIQKHDSPWGGDSQKLYQIYLDANADDYECPTVVTDKSHSSCGNSRFGCWTCTVVKDDKSMSAMIDRGNNWMKPLLDFRNELASGRNDLDNRSKFRRDGSEAINQMGNYTDVYRAKLLAKLLRTQLQINKSKNIQLISNQELVAIQVIWYRDGIFDFGVNKIYEQVFGKDLNELSIENQIILEKEHLKRACEEFPDDFELINNLLTLQRSKTLLMSKYGLQKDIEKRIESYITEK